MEKKTACDILGCPANIVSGETILTDGSKLIEWSVGLIFPFVIVLGIFMIIKSAYGIIKSEGVTTDVENAKKRIKGVFIGVGILMIGIVGYILLLNFFGTSSVQVELTKPEALEHIDIPFI